MRVFTFVEQEIARDGVFLNECGGWQLGQEVWDSWLSSEAQTVCKKERGEELQKNTRRFFGRNLQVAISLGLNHRENVVLLRVESVQINGRVAILEDDDHNVVSNVALSLKLTKKRGRKFRRGKRGKYQGRGGQSGPAVKILPQCAAAWLPHGT